MRVVDTVIHAHLNDRITRLDGGCRRLRSFQCRVGALRLPVYLEQISAALWPLDRKFFLGAASQQSASKDLAVPAL
jgi:hypothetical protein